MKCPNCSTEIANNSVFCEHCGKKIKTTFNPWIVISIFLAIVGVIGVISLYLQNHEEIEAKEKQIENIQDEKNILEMKVEEQNTFINMVFKPAQIHVMKFHGKSEIHFCNGVIMDPGGTDYYSNDCDSYLVVAPDISSGYSIKIQGPFEIEKCCDYVDIYEGSSMDGERIMRCEGNGECNLISSTGKLFIHFHSDYSETRSGFTFSVSCVPVES